MRHYLVSFSSIKGLGAVTRHRQLGVILIVVFLLRVSGNLYDMPYRFHPDEHHFLDNSVMMIRDGTLNPAYFKNPPLYTYAIMLVLYGFFGVEYVKGTVKTTAQFAHTLSWTIPHAIARGLSALAGAMTCLLLFLIGRRFGGEIAGRLAALFYGVAYLSVRDAHFAVNDVAMVCLVTLAFHFAARLLDGGRTRDLVFGGITAGLATATKYNGGIAFLPLLVACVLTSTEGERGIGLRRVAGVGVNWLILLVLGLAGFLVGNPYAALDSAAFLSHFRSQYGLREMMWEGQKQLPVVLLELEALVVELGWPLLLLFPLAAGYCLARGGARAKATILALSVVLPLIVYHALQTLFFARFLLPCTPFIALICAWGIVAFREANPAPWVRRPVVLGGAVVLLVASPFARSLYLDLILHRPDTRIVTKEYLDRVAPTGSTIVVQKPSMFAPPVNRKRHRLLSLRSDPSLLRPTGTLADLYLFNSFEIGHVSGILETDERALMGALERQGFARITFSPLRDGGELPFEADQVYLPYRHLFRYSRPGPTIYVYARPGMLPPASPVGVSGSKVPR